MKTEERFQASKIELLEGETFAEISDLHRWDYTKMRIVAERVPRQRVAIADAASIGDLVASNGIVSINGASAFISTQVLPLDDRMDGYLADGHPKGGSRGFFARLLGWWRRNAAK